MNTFENKVIVDFNQKQANNKERFAKLEKFVADLESLGLSIDDDIKEKMAEISVGIGENDKLRVVLIGGFSEGKTSIAAAWLGIEDSSMKISEQESSNEVKVYSDEYVDLVDTPGLFGYKEKTNCDTGKIEKYKDITKKYVSKAHIVLYVMNASNPIKESHSDDLRWLFRELNLLPRTIFVIGRFDNVADVTDEEDYNSVLAIKTKDILQRLDAVLHLSDAEKKNIKIVGVSANPFDEGINYWRQNPEEFKQLSKIDSLREATRNVIEHNGRVALVVDEQKSIVQDIIGRNLPSLKEKIDYMQSTLPQKAEEIRQITKKLEHFGEDIKDAKISLQEGINAIFSDMYQKIEACDGNGLGLFVDQEIGRDGCVLRSKIEKEIATKTETAEVNLKAISYKVNSFNQGFLNCTYQIFDKFTSCAKGVGADKIAQQFVKPVGIDGVKATAWEAFKKNLGFTGSLEKKAMAETAKKLTNLTGKLEIGLSALGSGLELLSLIKENQREKDIAKAKEQIKESLREMQSNCLKEFEDPEDFVRRFFPETNEMKDNLRKWEHEMQLLVEKQQKLEELLYQGEIIDVEFREM